MYRSGIPIRTKNNYFWPLRKKKLIFYSRCEVANLSEPQCTRLTVAQSLGPTVLHLSRLNQELVYSTGILTVQWDMLVMYVHQISLQYLCLARPGRPAAIIEPSSSGLWVLYPTAQIERIYQNEKVEKLQKRPGECENNCELVSAKKKNFWK
jgi:hypothetical protein